MSMKLSTIGAVTAAFAVSAVAGAQDNVKPIGLSLRAGLAIPTNNSVADTVGTGFFAFGAEYTLSFKPPVYILRDATSSVSLSVDYFRRDDYGNIPVLLNYILTKDRFSYSIGAGVGFATLPDDSDARFTYQLGVEYSLPNTGTLPLFLSAKFFGSEKSKLNAVGLYAGVKF